MATHSSILACRILWTEEPGGLQCIESEKSRTQLRDWARTYKTFKQNVDSKYPKSSSSRLS